MNRTLNPINNRHHGRIQYSLELQNSSIIDFVLNFATIFLSIYKSNNPLENLHSLMKVPKIYTPSKNSIAPKKSPIINK